MMGLAGKYNWFQIHTDTRVRMVMYEYLNTMRKQIFSFSISMIPDVLIWCHICLFNAKIH